MMFNAVPLLLMMSLMLIGLGAVADAAAAPRPELRSNKELGSIFNDDGANFLERLSAEKTTPDEYRKALNGMLDGRTRSGTRPASRR